jgi:hypothetical protein
MDATSNRGNDVPEYLCQVAHGKPVSGQGADHQTNRNDQK